MPVSLSQFSFGFLGFISRWYAQASPAAFFMYLYFKRALQIGGIKKQPGTIQLFQAVVYVWVKYGGKSVDTDLRGRRCGLFMLLSAFCYQK
jgi:hypothetical protein